MTIAVKLKSEVITRLREGNAHVVITGSTGWLGTALVHAMADALVGDDLRRLHLFGSKTGEVALSDGRVIPTAPLATLGNLPKQHGYYVFHFAFLTKDKQSAMSLEEYTEKNRAICSTVGAMAESHKLFGLCVTSSGAVYKSAGQELNRDRIKYPYAALKVEEEEYFRTTCNKKNIPLLMPRIFNIGGPYINKWQAYALSSLLAMALRGEKLVIAAKHPVIRSYLAVQDILQVLTCWLTNPDANGELTFDMSSPEVVEIGELAERICKATDRNISDIDRTFDPALPPDRYLGDSRIFLELVQNFAIIPAGLDEQIRQTMDYMRGML